MLKHKKMKGQLVDYQFIKPGFEIVYTGETDLSKFQSDEYFTYQLDVEGNVVLQYSQWGFAHAKEEDWNEEIRYINAMQERLGSLDESTRQIRDQIASLVCCDNGVPVTIDEVLNAISTGRLPKNYFHAGCWMGNGTRSTQPQQVESIKIIQEVLEGYLNKKPKKEFLSKYPYAKGFIDRTYLWLGPVSKFSELQKIMLKRALLPFEFFTKRNNDPQIVYRTCFSFGEEGYKLDAKISKLAGLPEIYPKHKQEFKTNLLPISDPAKSDLYRICGAIASGISELSDCHHNTFRIIENWIYSIGTFQWGIPTRKKSAEGIRLGQLLFGYALGLDRWLQGIPQQFLLLDLGHVNLGFDPKNEILRVYAYLGNEGSEIKRWLAACLWYKLVLEPPASLYKWGWRHKNLLAKTQKKGISICDWMKNNKR